MKIIIRTLFLPLALFSIIVDYVDTNISFIELLSDYFKGEL